ncbi:MAG: VPLPA-CTERM sorting domain-containing protein [Gammaproteobacteria bacterium]|nr:VPLPA-CTERM sorting domain-containing protein [Gammaproteobacteria bacterium]
MKKNINKIMCTAVLATAFPIVSQAAVITFDFTGRLVVAGPNGEVMVNNDQTYTPIAASLTYDTVTGFGSSNLSISMSDPFWGTPATFHDISMNRVAGTNLINGEVLVDWGVNYDMSMHVEWDATGLFNAIDFGLQAGDKLSGTNLYRDSNNDGTWDVSEWVMDIGSSTPYSDILQLSSFAYQSDQGPAPMAATSNSAGFDDTTPFPGIRGYLDIGSGNSMYVTSVSAVPVPAAVWLFSSGLIGLIGFARRKAA